MRVKKVNRYYCDYCKKSGCNAYWIRKHEERCTLNPNRLCGYCKMLDNKQLPIDELIALLPNPDDYKRTSTEFEGFEFLSNQLTTAVNNSLRKLRDITDSCPACIMASLRQAGIPVPMATDFDFGKESKEIWDAINAENLRYER